MSGGGPSKSVINLMGMMNVQKPLANIELTKEGRIELQITCGTQGLNDKQSKALETYLSKLPGSWSKSLLADNIIISLSQEICHEIMKEQHLKALGKIMQLGPIKTAPERPTGAPPVTPSPSSGENDLPPTMAQISANTSTPDFGSFPPIQEPATRASRKGQFSIYPPLGKPPPRPPGGPPIGSPQVGPPPRPPGGPPIGPQVEPPPRPPGGPPIGPQVGPPPRPQGGPPKPFPIANALLIATSSFSSADSINNGSHRTEYQIESSEDEIEKMCKDALNAATADTDFTIPVSKFKEKIEQILKSAIVDKYNDSPDKAPTIDGNPVFPKISPKKNL